MTVAIIAKEANRVNTIENKKNANRLWLRHPDRDTIIRIEVTELPRQDWPSLPELVR